MATYYDENFGTWEDMDDPDMVEFYHQVQAENVEKKCRGCGRLVKIRPDYAYCNGCADRIERGEDVYYHDPDQNSEEDEADNEAEGEVQEIEGGQM